MGLGLSNPASAAAALPVAPFVIVGAFVGRALPRILDQRLLERVALTLALVARVRLLR